MGLAVKRLHIEANAYSEALTLHPCNKPGLFRCQGADCSVDGQICDKVGCDINPYKLGNHNFYGKGSQFTINTEKPFTIITQFITNDGTDHGDLIEIKRIWQQDGKTIAQPYPTWSGL